MQGIRTRSRYKLCPGLIAIAVLSSACSYFETEPAPEPVVVEPAPEPVVVVGSAKMVKDDEKVTALGKLAA